MRFLKILNALVVLLCLCCASGLVHGQDVSYGTDSLVEYHIGILPIVLSVPHGGGLQSESIPDRSCGSPVLVRDANTIEMGLALQAEFHRQTGCYPHLVLSRLHRSKLDPNRELEEAACRNPTAELAWREYHAFIDSAQSTAALAHDDRLLLFDIHGHGHEIQRIELGYLLSAAELRRDEDFLNMPSTVAMSSIRALVEDNLNGASHSDLLRGEEALGTLLGAAGYASVPSRQDPAPDEGEPYFSGGYTTAVHSSVQSTNSAVGVQVELYRVGLRDTEANRARFAIAFVAAVLDYYSSHIGPISGLCDTTGTSELRDGAGKRSGIQQLVVYPTVLPRGGARIYLGGLAQGHPFRFTLLDALGKTCVKGHSRETSLEIAVDCGSGVYSLILVDELDGQRYSARLLLR